MRMDAINDPQLQRDLHIALRWASSEHDIFDKSDSGRYFNFPGHVARRAFVWAYLRWHEDRPRPLTVIRDLTGARSHSGIAHATEPLYQLFFDITPPINRWHHVPIEWIMKYGQRFIAKEEPKAPIAIRGADHGRPIRTVG